MSTLKIENKAHWVFLTSFVGTHVNYFVIHQYTHCKCIYFNEMYILAPFGSEARVLFKAVLKCTYLLSVTPLACRAAM